MSVTVLRADGLVTVQDRGRIGYAHLGVPRAGALDGPAAELGNRLVGNLDGSAVLEVTLGGLALRTGRALTFAVTGAECDVRAGGRARAFAEPVTVPAGAEVSLGPARSGVRSYLAVAGGFDVAPVLGSRSTDTLAGLGPAVVVAGTVLPVGVSTGAPRPVDVRRDVLARSRVRLVPGPRLDWFAEDTVRRLTGGDYVVTADSNRIGLRLHGPGLNRVSAAELPSEGMVSGAVQVPPDGQPVVLLHDHPVTGGYPVVGVVVSADLPVCAQLRPGDALRFSLRDGAGR
jgi:biotin-dependent carboxylase-like uncharacterized protein